MAEPVLQERAAARAMFAATPAPPATSSRQRAAAAGRPGRRDEDVAHELVRARRHWSHDAVPTPREHDRRAGIAGVGKHHVPAVANTSATRGSPTRSALQVAPGGSEPSAETSVTSPCTSASANACSAAELTSRSGAQITTAGRSGTRRSTSGQNRFQHHHFERTCRRDNAPEMRSYSSVERTSNAGHRFRNSITGRATCGGSGVRPAHRNHAGR